MLISTEIGSLYEWGSYEQIIKLLKDTGFHIEGTLKNRVIYPNKNGIPTYYNQLVYSNTNLEGK